MAKKNTLPNEIREETITITDIRGGISPTIYAGTKVQVAAMRDLDIFSAAGVIRPSRLVQWVSVNGVGSDPSSIKVYSALLASSGNMYIFSDASTNASPGSTLAKIYKNTNGVIHTAGLSAVASSSPTSSPTGNLFFLTKPVEFSGFIYWFKHNDANASNTDKSNFYLSRLQISNDTYTEKYTPSGGAGTYGSWVGGAININDVIPVGPIVFSGFIFYAAANKLYRCDGTTETVAYTFDSVYNIKSLTLYSIGSATYIAVVLDPVGGVGNSQVALYDGFSSLIDQYIDVGEHGAQAVRSLGGTLVCITSNNPYLLTGGDQIDIYVNVRVWAGGANFEKRYGLFINNATTGKNVFVPDGCVTVRDDAVIFGIDTNGNITGLEPAIYGFRLPNVLTEEHAINDNGSLTSNLDIKSTAYIGGQTYVFLVNATTSLHNFAMDQGNAYSANAKFETLAFQADPMYQFRIKAIKFKSVGITQTNTIAISESTDQAAFASVKTFNTVSGQLSCVLNRAEYAFKWCNMIQLRFALAGSSVSLRPTLIPPITIVFEISAVNIQ